MLFHSRSNGGAADSVKASQNWVYSVFAGMLLYLWRSRQGLAHLGEAPVKASRPPHPSLNRRLTTGFYPPPWPVFPFQRLATPLTILEATGKAIYFFFLITLVGVVLFWHFSDILVLCVWVFSWLLGNLLEGQQIYCQACWIVHFKSTFSKCELSYLEKKQTWRGEWGQAGMVNVLQVGISCS